MRFGIQVNPYRFGWTGNPWDAVAAAARIAEGSGFDSLWLYDHFLYEGGYNGHPVPEPAMESFTTLSAIAAITQRIRLGQLVVGMPYRNPALLTKMATTLDVISHGRSILGIGAGWHKREYEAYGWGQFEEVPVRLKRLEEGVQVIHKLWGERPASFEGKFYRLDNVMDLPAPVQKPHPPIMIGGSGEQVTLRLVAKYADWCNVSGDVDRVRQRFEVLRQHCQKVGRPTEELTFSNYTWVLIAKNAAELSAKQERLKDFFRPNSGIIGTPDQVIEQLGAYAKAGSQYCTLLFPDWTDLEPIRYFGETVIPALADA